MDFKTVIAEMNTRITLKEIAELCGLASAGHAHDLLTGRRKKIRYETGVKIMEVHKRVMRRKERK